MAQHDLMFFQNEQSSGVAYTERFVNIAKGGLLSADTNGVPTVLAGGTDGYYLKRDDASPTGLSWSAVSGSMVYPGAGIANSTGSAWGTSYTTTGSGTVVMLQTSPSIATSLITGSATFALLNTTATALSFAGAATSLTIGGTVSTSITHNYSTNPTISSNVKTINIGTGGLSGSVVNINMGTLNAQSYVNVYGSVLASVTVSGSNISSADVVMTGYLLADESGLYCSNADEEIATFDYNTNNYRYFNGTLQGNGAGIYCNGPFLLAGSNSTYVSMRIPHGTAPSSPVDGDMWTTTAGLYVRINGATQLVGGGTAPGGSDTYIQFNDGGVFNGQSNMTFNKSTNVINLIGSTIRLGSSSNGMYVTAGTNITFEKIGIFSASNGTIGSVRLTPGSTPSNPSNGDMWTTTSGLYVRINGVTVGPLASGSSSITGFTNTSNTVIGNSTGGSLGTSNGSTLIGYNVGNSSTGNLNTFIGDSAGEDNVGGYSNTFVGASAGCNNTSGYTNTYIGLFAGAAGTTSDHNIMLGNQAGYYETGSNKLFIDNTSRSNEANGRSSAMIYGVFNATPTSQQIWLNAKVYMDKLASKSSETYVVWYNDTTGELVKGTAPSGGTSQWTTDASGIYYSSNVGIGGSSSSGGSRLIVTPTSSHTNGILTYAELTNASIYLNTIGGKMTSTSSGTHYFMGNKITMEAIVNNSITNSAAVIGQDIQIMRYISGSTTGTLSTMAGTWIAYGHNTSIGTTTTAYGLRIDPYRGAGTITTMYDIYLGAESTGGTVTKAWAIYQANTKDSRLNGQVGIGKDPAYALDILGSIAVKGTIVLGYSNNNYVTTVQCGSQSGDLTLTLPAAAPAGNDYILAASTIGVMTWTNALSGTLTASNIRLTAPTTLSGTTPTWNINTSSVAHLTLSGNTTLSISNAVAGDTCILKVIQGSGSYTLTLPSGSKKTQTITISTTNGAIDILTFYYDGTYYYWNQDKNYV